MTPCQTLHESLCMHGMNFQVLIKNIKRQFNLQLLLVCMGSDVIPHLCFIIRKPKNKTLSQLTYTPLCSNNGSINNTTLAFP